jgi:hypothetical protein
MDSLPHPETKENDHRRGQDCRQRRCGQQDRDLPPGGPRPGPRHPFLIAAPLSTIDPSLPDGDAIPIEERSVGEVTNFGGVRTAPEGIAVYNPAFDVTPNGLITAIVTEAGISSGRLTAKRSVGKTEV